MNVLLIVFGCRVCVYVCVQACCLFDLNRLLKWSQCFGSEYSMCHVHQRTKVAAAVVIADDSLPHASVEENVSVEVFIDIIHIQIILRTTLDNAQQLNGHTCKHTHSIPPPSPALSPSLSYIHMLKHASAYRMNSKIRTNHVLNKK